MTVDDKLEKIASAAAGTGGNTWLTFQNGKWELTVDIEGGRLIHRAAMLATVTNTLYSRVFDEGGKRRKEILR